MNQLLDITGHFIYLALSVILFPLMIVLDCFLGLWMLAKFSRKMVRRISFRVHQKQEAYPMDLRKALVYLRSKSMNVHVNGN